MTQYHLDVSYLKCKWGHVSSKRTLVIMLVKPIQIASISKSQYN